MVLPTTFVVLRLCERLKKTDNRLDHLGSREQLIVVVIGVGKQEERLGSYCGIVQGATRFDRHNSIVPLANC
jgi:hypothetical protein